MLPKPAQVLLLPVPVMLLLLPVFHVVLPGLILLVIQPKIVLVHQILVRLMVMHLLPLTVAPALNATAQELVLSMIQLKMSTALSA